MHSGGKGGDGQKDKQMYNNETAKNNIAKIQFTYTFIIYSIFCYRKSVCPVSVKVF